MQCLIRGKDSVCVLCYLSLLKMTICIFFVGFSIFFLCDHFPKDFYI